MNYEYLWKALEELMAEFYKRGITVPPELLDDLKSAKTFINIYATEPTALNIATEIEKYLEKVEANLLYLASSDIGEEYADEYLRRIHEARRKGLEGKTTVKSRFVSGVPKNEHWIRIEISDLISDNELGELLQKLNLSSTEQENGYLLIHGSEENVKAFIKEASKKIRKKKA